MDYWEATVRFFSLTDGNVRFVLAGSVLLGIAGGVIGTFAFLQRKALVGDALAHAALPGVCLAFMLTGVKAPLSLLIGASLTGWLGALAVNWIIQRTNLSQDTALGLTLSVFFGIGVTLLTLIQRTDSGNQSGLDKFIFGQAAALSPRDVLTTGVVALVILFVTGLLFKEFKMLTFDPLFTTSAGRSASALQFTLTALIVVTVTVGLQTVGVALMAALLVTPAAAARQWTNSLSRMLILSGAIGALSGIVGAYISFLAPRLPTGPWVVITAGLIFLISLLAAPERGLVAQWLRRRSAERRVVRDHLLKAFYHLRDSTSREPGTLTFAEIVSQSRLDPRIAERGMKALKGDNLAAKSELGWALTTPGLATSARVVRLHRLWEVYLQKYLSLPSDHVHRDADELEHLITPEMEASLEDALNRPELDPHNSPIPYPEKSKRTKV
ncbi:MAG: metal ABC transporter permease [Candidatus Zixiibacteriota bacterium]